MLKIIQTLSTYAIATLLGLCFACADEAERSTTPSREALATVVIYNSSDSLSHDLATYYAKKRQIPEDHVIGLATSSMEEITRQEFDQSLAGPLRKIFEKNKWWLTLSGADGKPDVYGSKIRFVALMRGIPLKIKADPTRPRDKTPAPPPIANRNEASVDSEIAVLANADRLISGFVPNPYFQQTLPIMDWKQVPGLLLVCRLDGPSGSEVRQMIDDSLAAEQTGLWGWAYVDSRGMMTGSYAEGDQWLRSLASNMLQSGIPVIFDSLPDTLPVGFPVTDAAFYFGWYAPHINGPFAEEGFRFQPGAITAHIHSFSASTLRSPTAGWTGPLILRGAAASLGNVYEPYLSLTTHLDKFQDRLLAGLTLAESAYSATPGLSWMNVIVGDPLYRPFVTRDNMQAHPSNLWQVYQQAILDTKGDVVAAQTKLRKLAKQNKDSMFLEALANAQILANNNQDALTTLTEAETLASNKAIQFRLLLEKMRTLNLLGDKQAVESISRKAVNTFTTPIQVNLLMSWTRPSPPPPQPIPAPKSPYKSSAPAKRPSGESLKPKPPQPPSISNPFP